MHELTDVDWSGKQETIRDEKVRKATNLHQVHDHFRQDVGVVARLETDNDVLELGDGGLTGCDRLIIMIIFPVPSYELAIKHLKK